MYEGHLHPNRSDEGALMRPDGGGQKTEIRTVEPFGACLRAPGLWARTMRGPPGRRRMLTRSPAPSRSCCACRTCLLRTSGTVTKGGPVETVSSTLDPRGAFPPLGFWLITRSLSSLSEAAVLVVTRKPACWSICVASVTLRPVTIGTSTGSGPLLTTNAIAVLRRTSSPAGGSVDVIPLFGDARVHRPRD